MKKSDLYGRDATDPDVHAEVLRSISEMSFHDLVAEIEGDVAAGEIGNIPISGGLVASQGAGFMASSYNSTASCSFSGGGMVVPMSCPPSTRG